MSRVRARETLPALLGAGSTQTPDAAPDASPRLATVQELREVIERTQLELRFEWTRNGALNFELARLRRRRFGTASESLDSLSQAVLFDAILADSEAEDRAASQHSAEQAKPPAVPRAEGQPVREARDLRPEARRLGRQPQAQPVAEQLHRRLIEQRPKRVRADVTAKAIDCASSNWTGLTRCLDDGNVCIDHNAARNAVRPLAVCRKTGGASVRSRRATELRWCSA